MEYISVLWEHARISRLEQSSLQNGETERDQSQAEEKREHKQPLGSIQILFGRLHVAHVVELLGHSRVEQSHEARKRKTPAAQNGEEIYVLDMVVRDLDAGLVNGEIRIDKHVAMAITLH